MTQVFDAHGDSEVEPHVVRRIGLLARDEGDSLAGDMELRPDLRVPGARLALLGPVGSFCDTIGGIVAAIGAYPTPIVTADLAVALDARATPDAITIRPQIVRGGRSTVVTEMTLEDRDGGAACGYCIMSSTVLTDRAPQAVDPRLVTSFLQPGHEPHSGHFYDELGFVDEEPGRVTLELRAFLGNSLGMLHGGVTVMLAEAAAVSTARTVFGAEVPLAALEAQVRYLNGAREGPVVATGLVVGASADSVTVRVDQHDTGRDRRTSLAVVRVERLGQAADRPRN
jgi:uncharacterized protein (TIGR00369 family)